MKLRNVILAGLMFGMAHGMNVQAGEDKITKGYYRPWMLWVVC